MEIFSKELLEMDRNTVKLMIDQMQEKSDQQEETIEVQTQVIQAKDAELESVKQQKNAELEAAKQQMQCQAESFEQRIAELERKLAER